MRRGERAAKYFLMTFKPFGLADCNISERLFNGLTPDAAEGRKPHAEGTK